MGLISEGVDLLKLANKAQNVDLYKQLGEYIEKVSDLYRQNEELTTERNQLREQLRFKGVLERINGHTFVQGDDEEICSRCAEVDMRAVHLAQLHSKHTPFVKATCPACKLEMDHNVPFNRNQASKENPSQTGS